MIEGDLSAPNEIIAMSDGHLARASLAVPAAQPSTIYVSPAGNDAWSGRSAQPNPQGTDGPVATLERARDIVRQTKSAEASRVVVGGWPVRDDAAIRSHAGRQRRRLRSGAGSPAGLLRRQDHRGFQPAENGLWRVRISDVADGSWYFDQLFVNGRRATRARSPNKFYYYMLDVQEETLVKGSGSRPDASQADRDGPRRGHSAALRAQRPGVARRADGGLSQVGQHAALHRGREPGRAGHRHHRRGPEALELLGQGRPLPPGELPGRARRAGRMVPLARRQALLQAAARRGHGERPRSSRRSSRSSCSSRATSRTASGSSTSRSRA